MVCDVDLVEILLTSENMNLVLKENILSIKNFMDIKSENLLNYLNKIKGALKNHINNCDVLFFLLLILS